MTGAESRLLRTAVILVGLAAGGCFRLTGFCETDADCPAGKVCGTGDVCEIVRPDLRPPPPDLRDPMSGGFYRWARGLNASNSARGTGIALDGAGRLVALGHFSGTLNPGGMVLPASGGFDLFVAELKAADGNLVRAQRLGGTGNEYGGGIVIDGMGGHALGAAFSGTADFGAGNMTSTTMIVDNLAARYQRDNPMPVWIRSLGGTISEGSPAVAIASDGDIILAGGFTGMVNFGGGLVSSSGSDIFVARYSPTGDYRWSRTFSGTSSDRAFAVSLDGGGEIAVAGEFSGSMSLDGTTVNSAGLQDIFVAKLSGQNGQVRWVRSAGGSSSDRATAVAADRAGNVMVAGWFRGTIRFGDVTHSTPNTSSDGFIARYAPDGTVVWSRVVSTTGIDRCLGMAVDEAGDVIVTGSVGGPVDLGGGTLLPAGGMDIFVLRLAADGRHLWSRRYGSTGNDEGTAVAVDAEGVAVTGFIGGPVNFGGGTLGTTVTSSSDAFLLRLSP